MKARTHPIPLDQLSVEHGLRGISMWTERAKFIRVRVYDASTGQEKCHRFTFAEFFDLFAKMEEKEQ